MDAITAGPEATFASAKIQLCLAGPIGTPAGAQLLFAFFDVNGVFTNPSNTSNRVWRALFTPYIVGSPNPNPGGTTEGQALVPGRVALTMKAKSLKRGRVTITGRLLVNGQPYRGGVIELYAGTRKVAQTRTNARGQLHLQEEDPEEDPVHRADTRARRSRTAVSGATTACGSAGMQDGDAVVLRGERRHG